MAGYKLPDFVSPIFFPFESRQTRYIHPILDQCWASVVDGETKLVQYWVDVSCLLGNPSLYYLFIYNSNNNVNSDLYFWTDHIKF